MDKHQVLIVGAGPVGLTLALELGRSGVDVLLVDRLATPSRFPKMERVNPRTMEHFRRLGIADSVRAAGFPAGLPMDVFVTLTLADEPLVRHPQASVADLIERGAHTNDGSMPAEPYQLISQYTLEPLLRDAVAACPSVTTRFGWELSGFRDDSDGIAAVLTHPSGDAATVGGDYLVGCDGGSSLVRKQLGIALDGEPRLLELTQALIHAPGLFARIRTGVGRHYHFVDEHQSFMIVQDDTEHFTLHTVLADPSEVRARFAALVGFPVDFDVEYAHTWTMRSMVARSYGRGRVFLAGDAAHLMNPTAGLGMNTGVGDAIDLAWRLQAVLAGWAPSGLLDSYEAERRPIGVANAAYSLERFRARQSWRSAITPASSATPHGLAEIARLADANEAKAGYMEGVELGYSYAGTPLFDTSAVAEPSAAGIYRPYAARADVGSRLPHIWADERGTAVQDLVPPGTFTLLSAADAPAAAIAEFRAHFAAAGVPLAHVQVPSGAARSTWGSTYVIVRPDLHVVWRGDSAPPELAAVARRSSGRIAEPGGS